MCPLVFNSFLRRPVEDLAQHVVTMEKIVWWSKTRENVCRWFAYLVDVCIEYVVVGAGKVATIKHVPDAEFRFRVQLQLVSAL